MTIAGMSATGYSTVGDIVPTHMSIYHAQSEGNTAIMDILSSHAVVAPVVDDDGHLVGFLGESEILYSGKDINQVKVEDIMTEDRTSTVTEMTPISTVVTLFQDDELQIVPITREGRVIGSLSRHDLIRALTGAGLGVEK
ncbi:CBS domain-containing protein [Nitrospira sp. T9]|uniref:CBS domain-containing protein n=1 Tax=unclassified Nitrospira TaxID=2652172 RepID=UPI003F9E799C